MVWCKVSELEGELLDKAVFKALLPVAFRLFPKEVWNPNYILPPELPYSTDWAAAGPIIERERITLIAPDERPDQLGSSAILQWTAAKYRVDDEENEDEYEQCGNTPLVAAMRAFVSFTLGDEFTI